MQSDLQLSDWLGAISVFKGQLYTRPESMESGLRVDMVAAQICPPTPFLTADKTNAPYVLPCTLREATLIGKTLALAKARGLPLVGFMRSGGHVTEGGWIKLDLDSIGKDDVRELIGTLDSLAIGYLLYSTYSHGIKPRNRLRLVLFLDRALSPVEYKRASQGAAIWLLSESLDPSEGGLHQLAGVFMCNPDNVSKAVRRVRISEERYCVSADALLARVPERVKPLTHRTTPLPVIGNSKISHALRWIDANDTALWVRVGMALKALEQELGTDALGHWLAFSESADATAKQQNNDNRYNPEMMWTSFAPSMPLEAAFAQILALGRDGAAALVREAIHEGELNNRASDAVSYLEQRHQRFLISLLADAGIGGDV